jgi:hypothetical protein
VTIEGEVYRQVVRCEEALDMLLASSPVLRAYKLVTREYTPSTPMQWVYEHSVPRCSRTRGAPTARARAGLGRREAQLLGEDLAAAVVVTALAARVLA